MPFWNAREGVIVPDVASTAPIDRRARALRLAADFALLAVAAAWGLTFPFAKTVLRAMPVFTYLAVRFSMAAVILMLIAPYRKGETARRTWSQGVGIGSILFLGFAVQALGIRSTTASKAGFITGLSVALVPVISALWLRRSPKPGVLIGVFAATLGLALLTLGEDLRPNAGDLLVLGCAVCFALHIVLVGRLAPSMDAVLFATAQVVPVAVLSTLAAFSEGSLQALLTAPPAIWGMIVFMTVTGTVGALLVQNWAQRFTSATHTGLMFTFEPVAAAIAAFFLLGEVLSEPQAVGASCILGGIVTAELSQERESG
jgi:drug/metabolite transporter (DMT)-like permease